MNRSHILLTIKTHNAFASQLSIIISILHYAHSYLKVVFLSLLQSQKTSYRATNLTGCVLLQRPEAAICSSVTRHRPEMVTHPSSTSSSNVQHVPEAETPPLLFQWLSRSRKQLPAFLCDTQRPENMVDLLFIKSPFVLWRSRGQKQMQVLFCEAQRPEKMVDFLCVKPRMFHVLGNRV